MSVDDLPPPNERTRHLYELVAGPLVVLIGPPGCGKSTWAAKHFPRDEVVSLDGLRKTVSGDANNQEATRWAVRARKAIVEGRMYFGLTTVVDATNAVAEHREEIADLRFIGPLAHTAHGFRRAVAVIFDTPLDECLARNSRRRGSRRVPDEFIRECHDAIERDLPVASTWIPKAFTNGLRIRPDGVYQMGGGDWALQKNCPWYAGKPLHDCPDWVGINT